MERSLERDSAGSFDDTGPADHISRYFAEPDPVVYITTAEPALAVAIQRNTCGTTIRQRLSPLQTSVKILSSRALPDIVQFTSGTNGPEVGGVWLRAGQSDRLKRDIIVLPSQSFPSS